MSSVPVRKFQRLTVPAKPLPLEVPVYANSFNVSKQFNANALIYSELFCLQPCGIYQTTASFYASFSEVASGLVTRLAFSTGGHLNSTVAIVSRL